MNSNCRIGPAVVMLPNVGEGQFPVGIAEFEMIERIVRVGTELQVEPLAWPKRLRQREAEIDEPGTVEEATRELAASLPTAPHRACATCYQNFGTRALRRCIKEPVVSICSFAGKGRLPITASERQPGVE
jgi:hypothetical protein